ncbi:MAG: hypothetical protein ACRC2Y_04905 [Aeromonas veronii]
MNEFASLMERHGFSVNETLVMLASTRNELLESCIGKPESVVDLLMDDLVCVLSVMNQLYSEHYPESYLDHARDVLKRVKASPEVMAEMLAFLDDEEVADVNHLISGWGIKKTTIAPQAV